MGNIHIDLKIASNHIDSVLQDHPSSDSFYDSDFADAETTALGAEKGGEKEETEIPLADSYENPEVDGEWGRQLLPFLLLLHTH